MTNQDVQYEARRLALMLEHDAGAAPLSDVSRRNLQRKAAAVLRTLADIPLVREPEPDDEAIYRRWVVRVSDRTDAMRDQIIAFSRDLLSHHGVINPPT